MHLPHLSLKKTLLSLKAIQLLLNILQLLRALTQFLLSIIQFIIIKQDLLGYNLPHSLNSHQYQGVAVRNKQHRDSLVVLLSSELYSPSKVVTVSECQRKSVNLHYLVH